MDRVSLVTSSGAAPEASLVGTSLMAHARGRCLLSLGGTGALDCAGLVQAGAACPRQREVLEKAHSSLQVGLWGPTGKAARLGPPASSLLPSPTPLSRSNPETKLGAEKWCWGALGQFDFRFSLPPQLEPTFLPPHCFLEASLFLPPHLPYLPVMFVEGYSVPGTGKAEDLLRALGGTPTCRWALD